MGSAFIGYGLLMLLMLEFGKSWLVSHQVSQEYLDSWVITVWGVVNTFTEHGFFFSAGWKWSHKDFQHTFLGVIWACAGGLGIYLSRQARRSVIPGLVIVITGWTFQSHQQSLEYSTKIHGAFGFVLMAAGLMKTIGVIREDSEQSNHGSLPENQLLAFDHLTPLLLTISGVMFMSATEEQLILISTIGIDHATYVLAQVSVGCLIYLYFNLMISLYRRCDPDQDRSSNVDDELDRPRPFSLLPTRDHRPIINRKPQGIDGEYENLSMEDLLAPVDRSSALITRDEDHGNHRRSVVLEP